MAKRDAIVPNPSGLVTHNDVQWKRQEDFMAESVRQRAVVRGADVVLHDTARRMRRGVYAGRDGDTPTLTSDAAVHEIQPGVVSTVHRHSWDATLFIVEGSGWTEIDGRRFDWKPWDALHLPSNAWHRHGNDGDKPARFMSFSSEPIVEALGMAVVEDGGDTPASDLPLAPDTMPALDGDDPDARRARRLAGLGEARRKARLHTPYDQLGFLPTVKGTHSSFLVDQALGYQTSGLTQVMKIFPPGGRQSMHAHPGEAWLYIIEGRGHTYMGAEPTGGENYEWQAGDLVCVDHYCWHQHFNDDPDNIVRMIRVHLYQSVNWIMEALAHPLELSHEPSWALKQVEGLSDVTLPESKQPS